MTGVGGPSVRDSLALQRTRLGLTGIGMLPAEGLEADALPAADLAPSPFFELVVLSEAEGAGLTSRDLAVRLTELDGRTEDPDEADEDMDLPPDRLLVVMTVGGSEPVESLKLLVRGRSVSLRGIFRPDETASIVSRGGVASRCFGLADRSRNEMESPYW